MYSPLKNGNTTRQKGKERNTLESAPEILFSPFLASGVLVTCFILLLSSLVVVNPLYYDHLLIGFSY